MSRKGTLRISNRYQEIVQILERAKAVPGNFLWKVVSSPGGRERRLKFDFTLVKVDARQSRLIIETSEAAADSLQPGEKIYFKLVARNSAFKATLHSIHGTQIECSFPEEAAVTELREFKRYYFHPVDEKFVQLRHQRFRAAGKIGRVFNLLVCDVSQGGLCLFVPDSQEGSFDLHHPVSLESLGIFRLEQSIAGEVVFKMPASIRETLGQRQGMRIGIRLEQKIPLATFERFIVKKQVLSVSDDRVVLDEEFRARVHDNMKEIRSTLGKNKRLDRFFEGLAIPKAGNQYLKQHIEMLCEVLCGLAVKLKWVSERSIDKLIYVAFLHDVRFTQYPKLAQIPNLAVFEEQKRFLSENERKAFLEAPTYASELARQDLEAFPDAIRILEQQKELPDGKGFPHQITASQMAPLSCLFIVAHYFVDYVIDHPDWTTDDFVVTYRKRLKGQYFSKIFDAMSV